MSEGTARDDREPLALGAIEGSLYEGAAETWPSSSLGTPVCSSTSWSPTRRYTSSATRPSRMSSKRWEAWLSTTDLSVLTTSDPTVCAARSHLPGPCGSLVGCDGPWRWR